MKKLFLIVIVLTAVSCSVTEDNSIMLQTPTVVVPYIKGEKNGDPFNFMPDSSGDYFSEASQGYISGPNPEAPYCFYYGMNIQSREGSSESSIGQYYGVSFKNMVSSYIENEPDFFYAGFVNAPRNFLTEDQYFANMKGVEITYWSPEDVLYSSMYGSQSGSSMTITSATPSHMPGGSLKTMIVTGTFKCKLYDPNNPSDMVAVTNGKFRITCQAYY